MDSATLQKLTAAMAAMALVFSFLAWRSAARAEEQATFANRAASGAATNDAAWAVRELTDSLVAADLIPDPQYAYLADQSPAEVARVLCDHVRFEGQLVAATSAAEAREFARTLGMSAVSEAVLAMRDASQVGEYLEDVPAQYALARIADGWAEVAARSPEDEIPVEVVDAVWSDIEPDASVQAFGTWRDTACA